MQYPRCPTESVTFTITLGHKKTEAMYFLILFSFTGPRLPSPGNATFQQIEILTSDISKQHKSPVLLHA